MSNANRPYNRANDDYLLQQITAAIVGINAAVGISGTSTQISSVQTSASGATWVTLPSNACSSFSLTNYTGTTISVRQGAAPSNVIPLPSNTSLRLDGTNTNLFDIKRADDSDIQVTLGILYE